MSERLRAMARSGSLVQVARVIAAPESELPDVAVAGLVAFMVACAKRGDTLVEAKDKMRRSVADVEEALPYIWDMLRRNFK